MPALIDSIAWKNERPWHGLGVEVNEGASGEEMLKAASMEWTVESRKIALAMPPKKKGSGTSWSTEFVKGYRAITRSDTNQVFCTATTSYHPVQNRQVVDFFREFCEAGHATMETVGALKGGAIVWALARLIDKNATCKLQGVDELRGYMMLATSHDGSLPTVGKPTDVRVVCWNTLRAALSESSKQQIRIKHSKEWSDAVIKNAQTIMGIAIEQVHETHEIAAELSKHSIDQAGKEEFVKMVMELPEPETVDGKLLEQKWNPMSKLVLAAIESSPGSDLVSAKDTFWGAVNGVTYFQDHLRHKSSDARLYWSWFGGGGDLKVRAVNVAREMIGARVRK